MSLYAYFGNMLNQREVEGSIPSVGDIGFRSDMAGW